MAVPEATRRTSEAARRARCSPETTRQSASAGPASSSRSASEIESARMSTTSRPGAFLRRISTASRKTGRIDFTSPFRDPGMRTIRRTPSGGRGAGDASSADRRVDEGMADPRHLRSETAGVVPALLEAEEDEHRTADPGDRRRAAPPPGPYLRRDVEDDGDARLREPLRERKVEVRRVDEHRGVRALADRLRHERVDETPREADLRERLDEADDREVLLVREKA